jgi:RHS repeat-associated protein
MGNRLKKKEFAPPSPAPGYPPVPPVSPDTFIFDRASRIISAECGRYSNVCTRAYDKAGRLVLEGLMIDGRSFYVEYGFDEANRIVLTKYPDGKLAKREFSERDQLAEVRFGNPSAPTLPVMATFLYDPGMREKSRAFGNAMTKTTDFARSDNIPARIRYTRAGNDLLDLKYFQTNPADGYDANKNNNTENIPSYGHSNNYTSEGGPGYDPEDRLVAWQRKRVSDGGLLKKQNWTLSKEGDWTLFQEGQAVQTRTHNATHEIKIITDVGATEKVLSHDPKGNLTSNPAKSMTCHWDMDDLIEAACKDLGLPTEKNYLFRYDAFRRRVQKVGPEGKKTTWVNAGWRIISEYEDSGTEPVRSFCHGEFIDDLLSVSAVSGDYFFLSDKQFSVMGIADQAGNLVERIRYDPYGKAEYLDAAGQPQSGPSLPGLGNSFGFSGRPLDSDTDLMDYRVRVYDPSLGRFLNRMYWEEMDESNWAIISASLPHNDPLWNAWKIEVLSDQAFGHYFPGRMNLYDYALHNPAKFSEPSSFPLVVAIGGKWLLGLGLAGGAAIVTWIHKDDLTRAAEDLARRFTRELEKPTPKIFPKPRPRPPLPKPKIDPYPPVQPWRCCENHHIGSPFVPDVLKLFDQYGINIEDPSNKCFVCDVGDDRMHKGPHSAFYHHQILKILSGSMTPENFKLNLQKICLDLNTPNHFLRLAITCIHRCCYCLPGTTPGFRRYAM